jgi:hypothetical protein
MQLPITIIIRSAQIAIISFHSHESIYPVHVRLMCANACCTRQPIDIFQPLRSPPHVCIINRLSFFADQTIIRCYSLIT